MKTCKDCIYYVADPDYINECRLYPQSVEVDHDHWCGQLKEINSASSLDDLDLSVRSRNLLQSNGIDIHKLRGMTQVDLLMIPGCGRGTLHDILAVLYKEKVHVISDFDVPEDYRDK